jgi:alkylhydroperoxidase family enzyme
MTMARISPEPPAEWSSELTTFIADFRASVVGGVPDASRPSGANLLGTLARYPALAKAFLAFNGHLLYGSSLSDRQRELLILRVANVRRSDYEWAQHVVLAEDAGFDAEEIARIADGPDAPGWTPAERSLVKAVDELLDDGKVRDDTWAALAQELDENQLMDLVFTVGTYGMVAMALCSFGVEPDADLVPYLPKGR